MNPVITAKEVYRFLADLLGGGVGSGHFGHEGIPGHRGGSAPGEGGGGAGKVPTRSFHSLRHADRLVSEAVKMDPKVTPTLKEVAKDVGGEMVGLEHNIKRDKGRIAEKIEKHMDKFGISRQEAVTMINDCLRYTMAFETDKYVDGVRNAVAALEGKGFKLYDHEIDNKWINGKEYKGLNCIFEDPSGYRFELQFHTKQSFETKMGNHNDYKSQRSMDPTNTEALKLGERMAEKFDTVKVPAGVETLVYGQLGTIRS